MQNRQKPRAPEWTILKLLEWATPYFKSHDIDSPRATAEILLAQVLNIERIDLYLRYDQPVLSEELARFKGLIKRRISREPVAYIVGVKEFWSMDFAVTKDVLIPRPETEHLVEVALGLLPEDSSSGSSPRPKCILELGTGSGAIILALASTRSNHLFFASDRSIKAVALARKNATHHGLEKRVDFFCADWFTSLKDGSPRFDMIVSNPPYIPSRSLHRLQPEIYNFEPISALDGDTDGLGSLRHIINHAHCYLNRRGKLLLEIGHDQKNDVQKAIDLCNKYEDIVFKKDYSGHDRVVQMTKMDR